MSGILLSSFREGSRAELLADFIMSSIGLCTPIRRQDDIGLDFHCQVADVQEGGYLSFRSPFVLQVKSNLDGGILYGSNDPNKWKVESINWLFKNKVPFLIGEVNLETATLSMYDTTGLWQVHRTSEYGPSQIKFIAKQHKEYERRDAVSTEKLPNWIDGNGDGCRHVIDLGNPFLEISYKDLDNKGLMRTKMARLSMILFFEEKNIRNRDLGIMSFMEIRRSPDISVEQSYAPHPRLAVNHVLEEMKDALVSVAIKLKEEGRQEECEALKRFLKYVPESRIDRTLYKSDPELFDYLAPEV